jgi:hypothetical protein
MAKTCSGWIIYIHFHPRTTSTYLPTHTHTHVRPICPVRPALLPPLYTHDTARHATTRRPQPQPLTPRANRRCKPRTRPGETRIRTGNSKPAHASSQWNRTSHGHAYIRSQHCVDVATPTRHTHTRTTNTISQAAHLPSSSGSSGSSRLLAAAASNTRNLRVVGLIKPTCGLAF